MAETPYRHLLARVEQPVLVLTVTATELQDEKVAEALSQELLDAVAQFALNKVVVDLQHLKYVSSVAFRPLLRLRSRLQQSGGCLLLCGLTPIVGDIFFTTKMLSPGGSFVAPFQMEPDLAAALDRLKREVAGT